MQWYGISIQVTRACVYVNLGPNMAPNHVARAPARSFMRAAGFTDADFKKPFVSLSVPWTTGQPCNLHHRELGTASTSVPNPLAGVPALLNPLACSTHC